MGTGNKTSSQSTATPAAAVGRVNSIAGRAHGAKQSTDAALSKSPKKWYPQLEGLVHPEVVSAVRVMFDNLYQLRDQQHTSQKAGAAPAVTSRTGDSSGKGPEGGTSSLPDSTMATGIHGIRIQAATDPTSLKTGDTIRYNAATSQFEFGS